MGYYEETLEVLEEVGIEHLAGRLLTTLSGGEKSLALIAKALMQKPRVMLLDEPTANLDLSNRVRMPSMLKGLSRDKKPTAVFTTHDPSEALAIADDTIILSKGRVVFHGKAEEISEDLLEKVYGVKVEIVNHRGRR